MKKLAEIQEITVYMMVQVDHDSKIEFMRKAPGEWYQPSTFREDYFRVDSVLADKLEELWIAE
jgi:hypothetical protein